MLASTWVGTTPGARPGALQQHNTLFRTGFSLVTEYGMDNLESVALL